MDLFGWLRIAHSWSQVYCFSWFQIFSDFLLALLLFRLLLRMSFIVWLILWSFLRNEFMFRSIAGIPLRLLFEPIVVRGGGSFFIIVSWLRKRATCAWIRSSAFSFWSMPRCSIWLVVFFEMSFSWINSLWSLRWSLHVIFIEVVLVSLSQHVRLSFSWTSIAVLAWDRVSFR